MATHPSRNLVTLRLSKAEHSTLLSLLYQIIPQRVRGGYRDARIFERIAQKLRMIDPDNDPGT
jgi:hypothetical protein